MTEFKQFEDNISEKFKNFNPEINDALIWNAIENELPTAKKNNRGLIYFLSGLSFLIIMGSVFYKFNFSNTNTNIQTKTISKTALLSQSNTNTDDKKSNVVAQENINDQVSTDTQVKEIKPSANSIVNQNENIPIRSSVETNASFVSSQEQDKLVSATPDLEIQKSIYSNPIQKWTASKLTNNAGQSLTRTTKSASSSFTRRNEEIFVNPLDIKLNRLTFSERAFSKNTNDPVTLTRKALKLKSPQSIMLNFGYQSFNTSRMSTNANIELLDLRNGNESELERVNFALDYKKELNRKWAISGRIQFGNLEEKMEYKSSEFSTVLKDDQVVGVIHLLDGTDSELKGQAEIDRETRTTSTKYTTQQSVSLAIKMHYTLVSSSRFEFDLFAGFDKGVFNHISGFELDQNNTLYNITDDIENRYKNNFGDYALFGSNFRMMLTNNWYLNLGLEYAHGLNSVNTKASEIQKSYNLYGINLGAGLNF